MFQVVSRHADNVSCHYCTHLKLALRDAGGLRGVASFLDTVRNDTAHRVKTLLRASNGELQETNSRLEAKLDNY